MKNESLYNKTVDILVQAYFNDTLEHGLCQRCAIGNLCHASGFKINTMPGFNYQDNAVWGLVFHSVQGTDGEWYQKIEMSAYNKNEKGCRDVIAGTGYDLQELMKIEWAFETANKGNTKEDYKFNGLMSVIQALDIIHENNDTQVTNQSKNKFIKPQLVCYTL